jgi:hypothetical protein
VTHFSYRVYSKDSRRIPAIFALPAERQIPAVPVPLLDVSNPPKAVLRSRYWAQFVSYSPSTLLRGQPGTTSLYRNSFANAELEAESATFRDAFPPKSIGYRKYATKLG